MSQSNLFYNISSAKQLQVGSKDNKGAALFNSVTFDLKFHKLVEGGVGTT